jgi:hypothetical protein
MWKSSPERQIDRRNSGVPLQGIFQKSLLICKPGAGGKDAALLFPQVFVPLTCRLKEDRVMRLARQVEGVVSLISWEKERQKKWCRASPGEISLICKPEAGGGNAALSFP